MPAQDPKKQEEKVNKVTEAVSLPEKETSESEPTSLKIEPVESSSKDPELPSKEEKKVKVKVSELSIEPPKNASQESMEQTPVGTEAQSEDDRSDDETTGKSVLDTADISMGGEEKVRRGKKRVYTVGVVITALVLGAVGGVFYFRIREGKENLENNSITRFTSAETQTQKETVTKPAPAGSEEENESGGEGLVVTEALQLERSEISLEILNGTDIAGHAGDASDTFEELGYEIVKVGNAKDTTGNQLYVDPDFEGKLGVLLEDVESELGISSVSGDLTGSVASARIILGE